LQLEHDGVGFFLRLQGGDVEGGFGHPDFFLTG
jgi:hypothetical protein